MIVTILKSRCHCTLRVPLISAIYCTLLNQKELLNPLYVCDREEEEECSRCLALGTQGFLLRRGMSVGSQLEVSAAVPCVISAIAPGTGTVWPKSQMVSAATGTSQSQNLY